MCCVIVYALPCGMLCSGLCPHYPGRPLHLHGQRHHRHHSGQINNHTDNDQHCLLTPMPCVLCNAAVVPCQPYLRPSRRQPGELALAPSHPIFLRTEPCLFTVLRSSAGPGSCRVPEPVLDGYPQHPECGPYRQLLLSRATGLRHSLPTPTPTGAPSKLDIVGAIKVCGC